jgi:hypothetical protein
MARRRNALQCEVVPQVMNPITYAFKPIIVHELYHEFKSSVIWLDSGLTFGPVFRAAAGQL